MASSGRVRVAAVAGTLAALAGTGVAVAPPALAATTTCDPWGTVSVLGGTYVVQNDEWNSTAQQCITVDGTSFSVQTNQNAAPGGSPASYPSILKGCHWTMCTAGSGLPLQVAQIGSIPSSWSTTQPAAGVYDVAYDIWTNSTPTTSQRPDGTELMIWMSARGISHPAGTQIGTATLADATWSVWAATFSDAQGSWTYLAYYRVPGTTSLTGIDIDDFVEDGVARGRIDPATYLTDIEAGFEIWQGGGGLATTAYSADVVASNITISHASCASTPGSGRFSCSAQLGGGTPPYTTKWATPADSGSVVTSSTQTTASGTCTRGQQDYVKFVVTDSLGLKRHKLLYYDCP